MTPTVGRAVHYQPAPMAGPFPYAATVTAVAPDGEHVSLAVLDPNNACLRFLSVVPFAEAPTPGCWSWPPRA